MGLYLHYPLSRIHQYTRALYLGGVSNLTIMCSRCDLSEPKVHCRECSEDLALMCDACFRIHQQVPRLKTHRTTVFKKEFLCTKHPKKMVECYCHDCRVATCTECMFHDDHSSHKVEDLEQIIHESERKVANQLKMQRNELVDDEVLRNLTSARHKVDDNVKRLTSDAEKLRLALNNLKVRLNQAADNMDLLVSSEMDKLSNYDEMLRQANNAERVMSSQAESLLKSESDTLVVSGASNFKTFDSNIVRQTLDIKFPIEENKLERSTHILGEIKDRMNVRETVQHITVHRGKWNLKKNKSVRVGHRIYGFTIDKTNSRILIRTADIKGPIKLYSMDLVLKQQIGAYMKYVTHDVFEEDRGIAIDNLRDLYLLPCYSGELVRLEKSGKLKDKTKLSGNVSAVTYLAEEDRYAISDTSVIRMADILLVNPDTLKTERKIKHASVFKLLKICSGHKNGRTTIYGGSGEIIALIKPHLHGGFHLHTGCYSNAPTSIGKPKDLLGICYHDGKCIVCDSGNNRLLCVWGDDSGTHWETLLELSSSPTCVDIHVDKTDRLLVVGTKYEISVYDFYP